MICSRDQFESSGETGGQCALVIDPEQIFLIPILNFLHIAHQNIFPVVDQNDVLTHFFHLFHPVRGKQDGDAIVSQTIDFILDHPGVDGIKPCKGFVKNDQCRIMDDGSNELNFLLHPFGELFDLFIPPIEGFKTIEDDFTFPGCFCGRKSFELGEIDQMFADLHLFVQPALFGEISHTGRMGFIEFFAAEIDMAAIGAGDGGNDTDRRCLTGAIGAEHTENRTGLDLKGDFIYGDKVAVAFGHFVKLEDRVHEGLKMRKN